MPRGINKGVFLKYICVCAFSFFGNFYALHYFFSILALLSDFITFTSAAVSHLDKYHDSKETYNMASQPIYLLL